MWSEASCSDPILTRSLSGNRFAPWTGPVCIQPSPRARLSVGVPERDGSRFLRPDPHVLHVARVPPERNSLSLSTSVPTPFSAAPVVVASLVLGPGRLSLGRELDSLVPRSCPSSWWQSSHFLAFNFSTPSISLSNVTGAFTNPKDITLNL